MSAQANVVTVPREQLYQEVWTTPIRTLASKYGLSGVGLAKACARHDIPRPPRGYWAKLAFGKAPEQPQLPPLRDPGLAVVRFHQHEDPPPPAAPELAEVKPQPDRQALRDLYRQKPSPKGHAAALNRSEGLLLATRAGLVANSKIRKEEGSGRREFMNLFHPRSTDGDLVLDVLVGKASIRRAIEVYRRLIEAMDEFGFTVDVRRSAAASRTVVSGHGSGFEVAVWEDTRRVPHVKTRQEREEDKHAPGLYGNRDWDFLPSGRLRLGLYQALPYQTRQRTTIGTWADWKGRPLEEQTDDFIDTVLKTVEREVIRRRAEAETQARRIEEAKRQREAEEHRRAEQERVTRLFDEVTNWENAQRLRRYLRGLRRIAARRGVPSAPGTKLGDWLAWAYSVADLRDPLAPPPPSPETTDAPQTAAEAPN